MIVVFPSHAGDIHLLQNLLKWMAELGPLKSHHALLVVDCATPSHEAIEAQRLAVELFESSRLITNEAPTVGWPAGPWSLFQAATEYISEEWPQPFLIMEPDAIPLRPGWLDDIDEEYLFVDSTTIPNPFIGHIYECTEPGMLGTYMSGIAVYPPDTAKRFPPSQQPVHWDVHGAALMVSEGVHTDLIYHIFDGKDHRPVSSWWGKADTLVDGKPINISPKCAVFHRDKYQDLIRIQRRKLFPEKCTVPLINVVFPVHNGDIQLAIHHAKWLAMLSAGERWPNTAVISHDTSCNVILLNQFEALLKQSFAKVTNCVYPRPPLLMYPAAANFAWQRTALHMQTMGAPWFWLEADGTVLKKSWLVEMQSEYEAGEKPFMGPHVKQMSHSNGSMVYPANACQIMRTAMRLTNDGAFDYSGAHEYMPMCHDASGLLQHCWTIANGEPCEVGGGELPDHMSLEQANRWIRKDAVFFHRLKSMDLVNHLMSKQFVP